MENNETWRERFSAKFYPHPDATEYVDAPASEVMAFISAELLSLADKIGAERLPEKFGTYGPFDEMHIQSNIGFNSGLDTAISVIKEMAK